MQHYHRGHHDCIGIEAKVMMAFLKGTQEVWRQWVVVVVIVVAIIDGGDQIFFVTMTCEGETAQCISMHIQMEFFGSGRHQE